MTIVQRVSAWDEGFKALIKYKEQNKDSHIAWNCPEIINHTGQFLYAWVAEQRMGRAFQKMNRRKEQLMDSLGFEWTESAETRSLHSLTLARSRSRWIPMDTCSRANRGWVCQLDEAGGTVKSATQPQPQKGAAEQGSDKSRDLLVAVTRIERVTGGL
jgi:hypothetical protein